MPMPIEQGDRLAISVRDCARRLSISEGTAWAMVRAGRIPSVRISPRRVLVPVSGLNRLLENSGLEGSRVA